MTNVPDETNIDPLDLAWLAGLLEGEGCFTLSVTNKRDRPNLYSAYARIYVGMTDLDVIKRAARLMNVHVTSVIPKDHRQTKYIATFTGARALRWMNMLRPYMGERRREQIDYCNRHQTGGAGNRRSRLREIVT